VLLPWRQGAEPVFDAEPTRTARARVSA
jgi:hypothetical protein